MGIEEKSLESRISRVWLCGPAVCWWGAYTNFLFFPFGGNFFSPFLDYLRVWLSVVISVIPIYIAAHPTLASRQNRNSYIPFAWRPFVGYIQLVVVVVVVELYNCTTFKELDNRLKSPFPMYTLKYINSLIERERERERLCMLTTTQFSFLFLVYKVDHSSSSTSYVWTRHKQLLTEYSRNI